MKTQFDHSVRVVSLENLKAMCERVSGMCHKYQVVKVTTNRVHVEYSNPNEYGSCDPRTAVFPCWSSTALPRRPRNADSETDTLYRELNPTIALEIMRVIGETDADYDAGQMFWTLTDCEPLYRSVTDGRETWETEYEIYARKYSYSIESRWFQSCIQFWRVIRTDGGEYQFGDEWFPGDAELKAEYGQVAGEYRDYRDAQRAVVEHCRRIEGRQS